MKKTINYLTTVLLPSIIFLMVISPINASEIKESTLSKGLSD